MKIKSQNNFWLIQQFKKNPETIFIKNNSSEFTFSQVFELSKMTSQYFVKKGIKNGNHVAIISENNLDFIITVNALWFVGAIPILINNRLKENEIINLLKHSDSDFLIIIGKKFNSLLIEKINKIYFHLDKLKSPNNFNDFVKLDVNKTAVMIYSSGSTGNPKLVQITFKNLFSSFTSADKLIKHSPNDIWLASLPFFHIGGFSIFTRAILSGSILAIPKSLKENDLFDAIKKFKPTLISLVPTMLKRILENQKRKLESIRIAFIGGGPSTQKLISDSIKNNFPICTVYGSTETSSMVTFADFNNLKKHGISAGITFPNVELKIINKNYKKITNGKVGEIVITSDSIALSYYKNEKINNLKIGKFFTNDLGKIDENGNLQVLGRKDDIVISGGENISLNEIRNLLLEKFKYEFETLKIADENWGESYFLIIEAKKSIKIKNEITQYLRKNIASYKLPKEILFVNKFPRTELGKIKKSDLVKILN
ncbi:MAG: acyl--CoA ligase [Ignavibacteriae bacterium]|nr:acyl--CoA ligase [Ignavibacteriota bacterium]